MRNAIQWFFDRADEPSTVVALAGLLGGFGLSIDEGTLQDILVGVAAVLGAIGIVKKEKGGTE